jgi:small subunit ribosomal protein S13
MEDQKTKHIVRVANTDIKGHTAVVVSLKKIKGVGYMYANAVCKIAGINTNKKAGLLNESELSKLTEIIKDPSKYKLPSWMLNRRKDMETGEDKHLLLGDLQFTNQNDVRRLQKIKSNRGLRHAARLPLRGQRTKSNFRRNKGKGLGVKKKKGKSGRV